MAVSKDELYGKMKDCVVDMDEVAAVDLAGQVISEGYDAFEAIDQGFSKGMEVVSKLYDEEEYFIPELLLCSDAMYAGIDVLKPHIKVVPGKEQSTVVLGVVQGDTHDIGKNLVKIMLESAGFNVIDMGRDIPAEEFVAAAKAEHAEIIALSALMTTAMPSMKEVVDLLEREGIRSQFKILIGGGPVSQAYAKKIGADAYAANAAKAVQAARELVGQEVLAE
jgi:corrinoid protein of di/trimethylamine methyltransferase